MRLPAVVTVSLAAPAPRQFSFAAARRGRVETIEAGAPAVQPPQQGEIRPWRPRPRRLATPSGASAQDRLKAMTETRSGAGMLMVQPSPEEAARAICDYLVNRRFIEEGR
jgi:electron transfer flavoprotein beta subunit